MKTLIRHNNYIAIAASLTAGLSEFELTANGVSTKACIN